MAAARCPPRSKPQNNHDFPPRAMPLSPRSAAVFERQTLFRGAAEGGPPLHNLSPATQRSYISAVSKFSRYFGRSPDKFGVGGRSRLPGASRVDWHFVAGAEPDRPCAAFLLWRTLGEAVIPERIPYAREPRKLPTVLSRDEVQFLEAVSSLKSRVALTCCYAAGLRASEVAALGIADIDSARGVILVRHGKGGQGSQRDAVAAVARHSTRLLGAMRESG